MLNTSLTAANAYNLAQRLTNQAQSDNTLQKAADTNTDFGAMVKEGVMGVLDKGQVAEKTTSAMVHGKADVVDVVTAVAETEVALETMVSVRDRMISAYEEVMRMSI
ncbi:flagellar hook-basal body complex protein FliE [Cohaesibacter celericrescens]|uniref:Flagellar hook-basal body complex protein FliE n=1 Tax=Cohaesibacter celericrescens TaxID=2067669 RepID=A0A2N5XWE5_9HYPH|nr:flagellar hook-basal body complex protein FliE [Cohaesibacter celericrescens]PLW78832.1 flagellar hook-basal body protein FliE [Cohaesibacter celericrescens]